MRAGTFGLLTLVLATGGVSQAQQPEPPRPLTLPPVPLAVQAPAQTTPAAPDPKKADAPKAAPAAPAPQQQPGCTPAPQQQPSQKVDLSDHHCGPCENFWVETSYLMWWLKEANVPIPLATTGTTGRGVLGAPDTKELLGDNRFDYGNFSGLRVDFGLALDCQHYWSLEGGLFVLESRSKGGSVSSDAGGNPVLARPFLDVTRNVPGTPSSLLIAAPGVLAGSLAESSSARLWGLETNFARNLAFCDGFAADLLFGFRYLDLTEGLQINQAANPLVTTGFFFNGAPLAPGTSLSILDRFHTRNQFYGGQFGGRLEWQRGPITVDLTTKVALGPNFQALDVLGATTGVTGGTATTVPSGFLALNNANTGRFVHNYFAIAPELNVQVGYRLSSHVLAHVGYDFLYINSVVRPGSQLNPQINTALVPVSPAFVPGATTPTTGAAPPNTFQPSPLFKKDDFWAQGIQLGIEFVY